jgi:DNA-binding response OmpR family regulator
VATHVLVVDDNHRLSSVIQRVLEIVGYTVYPAPDAEAALSTAQQHRVDVGLIGLQLPGMDGYRLCAEMRTKHNFPVILMSGYCLVGDTALAASGASGFIHKPFDLQELEATIQMVLQPV